MQSLGKRRIFLQRTGTVAGLVTHGDDAAHHVFTPRVESQHLSRRLNCQRQVGVAPGLRNALGEAAKVRVAVPFANRFEPLVVDLGQEIVAVEFDRFGQPASIRRGIGEHVDVEPHLGLGVPRDFVGVDDHVLRCRLRQRLDEVAQGRAQLSARGVLFVVWIEQKREVLTRDRGTAVQQKIGQHLQRLARRRQLEGTAVEGYLEVAEEAKL